MKGRWVSLVGWGAGGLSAGWGGLFVGYAVSVRAVVKRRGFT